MHYDIMESPTRRLFLVILKKIWYRSMKKNKISPKTKQKNLALFVIVASTIALIYFITIIKLSQVGVKI